MIGKILVIVGPSGSGKSTLSQMLSSRCGVPELVSTTTRSPRRGEKNGVNYHYVSEDEFINTEMVETTHYAGNRYGLSVDEAIEKLAKFPLSAVVVDVNGLHQLKKRFPKRIVSVFVECDEQTLIRRMRARGDNAEQINKRILFAKEMGELDNWAFTDFVVNNNNQTEEAFADLLAGLLHHDIMVDLVKKAS